MTPPREITPRPYRSHLRPACLPCRRRKSRCKTDDVLGQCLMCQAHGTVCEFPENSDFRRSNTKRPRRVTNRRSESQRGASSNPNGVAFPLSQNGPIRCIHEHTKSDHLANQHSICSPTLARSAHTQGELASAPTLLDSHVVVGERNPHIIGPVVANDNDMLQDYLSTKQNGADGSGMIRIPRSFRPGAVKRPVMFRSVQKQPVGLTSNRDPAFLKTMVIEKLVEPFGDKLIQVYLEKANCCLPLLDEQSLYGTDRQHISPTLLASLYANALIYWRYDTYLASNRCPDIRFIWNLAIEAIYIELQRAPGMSTIISILLNISGRPTTSMMGNAVQIGSAIALSHSLGLNRDPGAWEISASEKNVRRRIWWAVVIFDYWSSMSYGTPPQLHHNQHDVCVPAAQDMLDAGATTRRTSGAAIYVAFIGLTKVLGICLDYVYRIDDADTLHTGSDPENPPLDTYMFQWEESLDENIRHIILRGTNLGQPGAASFRLAYLSVKLLLYRIEIDLEPRVSRADHRFISHQYVQAQRVSEEIIMLVRELKTEQLGDFWLSVSPFSLSSTMSFLVRRTLESRRDQDTDINHSSSYKLAKQLVDILRSHRQNHGWDIGDICLSQYGDVIDTLEQGELDPGSSLSYIEEFVPDVNVDHLFPSLWDMFETEGAF